MVFSERQLQTLAGRPHLPMKTSHLWVENRYNRKQEKQQEIQNLYLKIQKYSADKWGQNGEFFKEQEKLMQPVFDKINVAIKAIGEEEGFDYIFDTVNANIVYASPSQPDITSSVRGTRERRCSRKEIG